MARLVDGRTLFPAEAFDQTMEPLGVSQAIKEDWLMQIARIYAAKGQADVAYQLPQGKVRIVRYAREPARNPNLPTQPGRLAYSYEDVSGTSLPAVDLSLGGQGLTMIIPKAYRASFAKTPFDITP